jgi:hypothetical protein
MKTRCKSQSAVVKGVRALALASAALLVSHAAHADMWIYTDAQGVKHFASSQLDQRYKLMFRGMPVPDTGVASDGTGSAVAREASVIVAGRTVESMETSPSFLAVKPHMRTAADANQLDMSLLHALIATESGFNPGAVSPKGAVGLMQVMPATAQRYGVENDRRGTVSAKLADPKTNIQTGARYLRDLINMFPGQLELAVAAYNAGEGAVQRAGNKIPNFKETQNYVRSVMQLYQRFNPQARAVPAAAPATRVQGQFHSPNPNVNLRWGELIGTQDADLQSKKAGHEPLQPGDMSVGAGHAAKAAQSLTELSN